MELEDRQYPHLQKSAAGVFVVPAGKTLKIETSPQGDEILSATVPKGKVWSVSIVIDISETDA